MSVARRVLGWTTGEVVRSPVAIEYQRLWAAVLERTGEDLRAAPPKRTVSTAHPNPERERDWLYNGERMPTSFLWICELLGVDPDYTRRMLLHPPDDT